MRSFLAVLCAAVAGFMLFGAVSVLMSPREVINLMAMLCGFLGGGALMGALLAFRRPTEAELLQQKEAKPTSELVVGVVVLIVVIGAMMLWARYKTSFGF